MKPGFSLKIFVKSVFSLYVIPVLIHNKKRHVTSWICSWKNKVPNSTWIYNHLFANQEKNMPLEKEKERCSVCVCAIPTISVFQILSSKFPTLVVVNPAEVGNSSNTLGAAWQLFGVAAAIGLPNHRRGWRSFFWCVQSLSLFRNFARIFS